MMNQIGDVIVRVLASSTTKTDWLEDQDKMSEWGNMSTHELLFQRRSTIKFHLNVLVEYKADLMFI